MGSGFVKSYIGLVGIVCAVLMSASALAQSGASDIAIAVEYIERQNVDERLQSDGVDLLGDSVDLNTGALQFEHVDVSLPGNSHLEVAIRRTRSQGFVFPHLDAASRSSLNKVYSAADRQRASSPFADWSLETPKISGLIPVGISLNAHVSAPDSSSKSLCSFGLPLLAVVPIPGSGGTEIGDFQLLDGHDISNGLELTIPGQGSKKLLETPQGVNWPTGTIKVTKDYWVIKCGPADNGAQGFIATAPNGDVYKLDKFRYRLAAGVPVEGRSASGSLPGGVNYWSSGLPRVEVVLQASEVTDVNGNWVRYTYNNRGWVTGINGSDGRSIQIHMDSNDLITSVTANGRSWHYTYQDGFGAKVLSGVGLPDGRAWMLNLHTMPVGPNHTYDCEALDQTVSMTHPNGVTGTFVFSETRHVKGYVGPGGSKARSCITSAFQNTIYYDFMSLKSKTLSGPGYPFASWNYSYSGYTGGTVPSTKWGQVIDPLGQKTKATYHRIGDLEGLALKTEYFATTSSSTPLQTSHYTYVTENPIGISWLDDDIVAKFTSPRHRVTSVTTKDGDTFTTNTAYNTNQAASNYSYGNPTSVSVSSSVTTTPRVTDTSYTHKTTPWVLGLPSSITTNGRNIATMSYDSLGRKTSQTRYGAAQATFTYHTSAAFKGALRKITDALGRNYEYLDYKRGRPQRFKRPDGLSAYQYVDNNGWITSGKDARGFTTSYNRDSMGRLTKIIPSKTQKSWDDTNISYSFGSNIVQTITKGNARTVVTYDSLTRPILERTQDLSGGTSSYVKTSYNALGQTVFNSFPSSSSSPTAGTNTSYDGLGRVVSTAETVAPFATTSTAYLSSHRTRATDASGKQTTHYNNGYGELVRILQPLGVNTYLNRNGWGEMTSLRQAGTQNGYTSDKSQYYYYDSQYRLCRHRTPEGGDMLMRYDAAGQMTDYSQGEGAGTGCGTMTPVKRTTLYYDLMGRNIHTNFWTNATLDTVKTYDNNGNVLSVKSGLGSGAVGSDKTSWNYNYDELGHLTSENLSLDGRNYDQAYTYDTHGFMTGRTLPSGRVLTLGYDGLGRASSIASSGTSYASAMSYHPSGPLSAMTYGNGQVFSQTLNARLQPLRNRSVKAANVALDLTYSYDIRGKVSGTTNAAITGDNRTYSYDDLGRLTSSTGSWGSGDYTYDALGNMRTKTVGGRALVMSYDGNNRLTSHTDSVAPARTLGYDSRGNVTALGGLNFVYNLNNQPVSISGSVTQVTGGGTSGGGTGGGGTGGGLCPGPFCGVTGGGGSTGGGGGLIPGGVNTPYTTSTIFGTYTYDGNLKRVKSVINGKTIYNVFDAGGTLVHIDAVTDNKKTDMIGKVARITNNTVTYLHADQLGSANTGTDASGLVSWREQYTPFGTTLTSPIANNDQAGFTGHIKDSATGLNYMQARYYDPLIGRFLSRDPIGFSPERPEMFSSYTYVGNDPVNNTDPTGKVCVPCVPAAIWAYRAYKVGRAVQAANKAAQVGAIAVVAVEGHKAIQAVTNDEATPLPDGLVGDSPSGPKGKRRNSGPLTPENGGTGNAEEDFGTLGGGTSEPASTGDGMPDGSQVAPNGTRFRPGTETKGPRIDVPANGDKPHETLHYPDPPPPPTEER